MTTHRNELHTQLSAIIGSEKTTLFFLMFGGVEISFIKNKGALREFSKFVPDTAIDKMIFHFKGCAIYIPKMQAGVNAVRNAQIMNDLKKGLTVKQAAIKYMMTGRNIAYIKSKHINKMNEGC